MRRFFLTFATLVAALAALFAMLNWTPATLRGQTGNSRILLWHTLTEPQAVALSGIITAFRTLNPGADIKMESFESQEVMLRRIGASLDLGLGPDLILGPAQWTSQLANADAIAPIGTRVGEETLQRYAPASVEMLRYNGELYGIPQSLSTLGLYYNRNLVDSAPTTLDDLTAQAAAGNTVLMVSSFYDSFWGIQAFGGRLFDEEGRAILGQGGFANWLAWLKSARDAPGYVLDTNRDVLRGRFIEGQAAYYIGEAFELNTIIEALGAENVGVAPLPSGPTGSAGPFLRVQSFLFSTNSSPAQRATALSFAIFATNAEQSSILMREARHVPANARVRVNPRLNPAISAFATQVRSAVSVPNIPQMQAVWTLGGDAVTAVLEGVMEPAQAAFSTASAINEANGFGVSPEPAYTCTDVGSFRLVHTLEGAAAQALTDIIARFKTACPLIIVQQEFDAPANIAARFDPQARVGARPHLLLAPHTWLNSEENRSLVQDISPLVAVDSLQRFRPSALDAMRRGSALRGLPFAIDLAALYYNRNLIGEPARLLGDLRVQAAEGRPVILDRESDSLFWGIAAVDGLPFDTLQNGAFRRDALAAWLRWLSESQSAHNIRFLDSHEEAIQAFMAGETAYLVGSPTLRPQLIEALGQEVVGAARLPAGPGGDAAPLLTVHGFLVSASANATLTNLALQFVQFATNSESEELLVEVAGLVPSNAAVSSDATAWLAPWIDQIPHGILIPPALPPETLAAQLQAAYTAALNAGTDPQQTAATTAAAINRTLGVEELPSAAPTDTPTIPATPTATPTAMPTPMPSPVSTPTSTP